MTKKFLIKYELNGKVYETAWYARTSENAKEMFTMWHGAEVKIIDIK